MTSAFFYLFGGGMLTLISLPEQLYETSCSEELQEAHIHHLKNNDIKENLSQVQKHCIFNAISVLKKVNLNVWQTCHDLFY
jgi:hypothetical protein